MRDGFSVFPLANRRNFYHVHTGITTHKNKPKDMPVTMAHHQLSANPGRKRLFVLLVAFLVLAFAISARAAFATQGLAPNSTEITVSSAPARNTTLADSGDTGSLQTSNPQSRKVELTDDERNYLSAKKTLTVCLRTNVGTATMRPFRVMADRLNIGLTPVLKSTMPQTMDAIKTRECDIVPLVVPTPDRQKYLDFTTPWLNVPYVITVRDDVPYFDDISAVLDKKFGVNKGYWVVGYLRKTYPGIQLEEVDNADDGIRRVRDGSLFGMVDLIYQSLESIQTQGITNLKIAGKLNARAEMRTATRNDEPQLHSIFQKAVDSLTLAERQDALNSLIAVRYDQGFDYGLVWKIGGLAAIIVCGVVLWNRRLAKWNKEINEKNIQLAEANAVVLAMARTDGLTGIANRRWFDESLAQELARAIRSQTPIGLLLIDIDWFKPFNDNYGHSAGDDCLKAVAQAIQNVVKRPPDMAARYGGEELACILPITDGEGVEVIGNAILDSVRALAIPHAFSEGADNIVTVSCGGVAIVPKAGMTPKQVIDAADAMLYVSKDAGRNRLTVKPAEV